MDKIYRGYVSSVSADGRLDDLRNVVKDKMIEKEILPIKMEQNIGGTGNGEPLEYDIAAMDKCDCFLFIVDWNFGTVVKNAIQSRYPEGCPFKGKQPYLGVCNDCDGKCCNLTYVQFEYLYVKQGDKPYAVLLGDSAEDESITVAQKKQQEKFVEELKVRWCHRYNSIDSFSAQCDTALNNVVKRLNEDDHSGALSYGEWLTLDLPNGYIRMEKIGYNPGKGIIINHDGGDERQIILRTKTFNNLLGSIGEYIEEAYANGDENQNKEFYKSLLHFCGRKCGISFADRNAEVLAGNRMLSLDDAIKRWCEFDAKVGFGKLSLKDKYELVKEEGRTVIKCVICIEGSFVSDESDGIPLAQSERCVFIRGYCEGVFERLVHYQKDGGLRKYNKVVFECKNNEFCPRMHKGDVCEYNITGYTDLEISSK